MDISLKKIKQELKLKIKEEKKSKKDCDRESKAYTNGIIEGLSFALSIVEELTQ